MSLLAVCQCFCRCVGLYPIYYTVYYAPLHRLVFRGRVGIQGTSSYPSDRSSVLSCVGDSLYSRTGVWCGNLLLQNIKLSTFYFPGNLHALPYNVFGGVRVGGPRHNSYTYMSSMVEGIHRYRYRTRASPKRSIIRISK